MKGGKNLRTIWTELEVEFPEIFNLCTSQFLWLHTRTGNEAPPDTGGMGKKMPLNPRYPPLNPRYQRN